MSTLSVGTIKSTATTPPIIQNSSGTAIGTFCRAWVNFNGEGTVAIRAQFNVSSITDNSTGIYTVNFTTAMADVNYAVVGSVGDPENITPTGTTYPFTNNTGSVGIYVSNTTVFDPGSVNVSVFR